MYALIKNGVVENIIEADYPNIQTIAELLGVGAVCIDQYPVAIGDAYTNGSFIRNGIEVQQNQTPQQQIYALQIALISAQDAINSLLGV